MANGQQRQLGAKRPRGKDVTVNLKVSSQCQRSDRKPLWARRRSPTFRLVAIIRINICGPERRNALSSSEMNGPPMYRCLCDRLVLNIYWDECIKACPVWWVASSFPRDRKRKLHLSRTLFHLTRKFIKGRWRVTRDALIMSSLETEKNHRRIVFLLRLHKLNESLCSAERVRYD